MVMKVSETQKQIMKMIYTSTGRDPGYMREHGAPWEGTIRSNMITTETPLHKMRTKIKL